MKFMIKRCFAVLLCICLIASGVTAMAAEDTQLLINGDFEAVTAEGMPEGWEMPVGEIGKTVKIENADKDHKNVLRIYGDKTSCYITQEADVIKEITYRLSLDVKRVENRGGEIRIEYFAEDGSRIDGKAVVKSLGDLTAGRWENVFVDFTPPGKAVRMQVMLRLSGGGEYLFDNALLQDAAAVEPAEPVNPGGFQEDGSWIPKAVQGTKNLIQNSGFEELNSTEDFPEGLRTQYPTMVKLNSNPDFVYNGDYSMRIACNDTTLPWARFTITEGVVPGAECTFSAWIYSPTKATLIGMKTEYYITNYDHVVATGSGGNLNLVKEITAADGWTKMTWTEQIPDKTDQLWFYIRLCGQGEVYFDDVSYTLTKGPEAITTYMVDNCFYYSDWEGAGNVTLSSNTDFYPEFIGCPVEFSILDGKNVVYEGTVPMGENGDAVFEYPLTLFEEDFREYVVRGELYDKEGRLVARKDETVYRVPRPEYITKEGFYEIDGKRFDPVYVYHADLPSLDQLPEYGVNLIQGYAGDNWLNKCEELGLKLIIVLYRGGSSGQSAGHPDRIKQTIENVKKLKDHPTTFAYALMDEPTATAWPDLKKAYLEIRKIDQKHPILITMNHNFDTTGRFCDIVSMDSYPYGFSPFTVADYNTMKKAVDVVGERKPTYDLLQAFDYKNSYPTANEIRNMAYQAYWAGGNGIGYFSWDDPVKDENGQIIKLPDSRLGDAIKSFHQYEHQEVVDHFVYGDYPTFTEVRKEKYWYRAWVKDKTVSVVVLNKMEKEEVEAEIVLKSADGTVSLGDIDVSVTNGDDAEPFKAENGTFTVTLEPGQAVLYSVKTDADLSNITSSRFLDMYEHGWADKAVKALDEKDVLYTTGYNKYRPAENITRADFAYMLMRMLGITGGEAELFGDVKELAYYAPEIRAGRAAGLLNGIGDSIFGVDNEITRQDMMVMCVRALEYKGLLGDAEKADLAAFSDSGLVADYATDAVSKMVGSGLIRGNADGTMNPTGSATRAEAAVMLARLMETK